MTQHNLRLHAEPFNSIATGRKTIEARLYDTKRQSIKVGDTLIFIDRQNPDQVIHAEVVHLLKDETFDTLFTRIGPSKFGGPTVEWLVTQISEFYSLSDQKRNGVIGIEFTLAPKC